jgi:hypothetical protein
MTITKSINVCLHCEKTFEAGKKTARFCSSECRRTIIRACLVCGDDFKTRRDGKIMTCSDECRSTQNKWPMKGSQKQCEVCNEAFTVKNVRWARTCGRTCGAALRVKEGTNSQLCIPSTWQSRLKRCVVKLNTKWRNYLVQCEQCGRHRATKVRRCKQCIERLSPRSLQRIRRDVDEWLARSMKKCRLCEQTAEWWSSLCGRCSIQRDKQLKKRSGHKARCRQYFAEYQSGINLSRIIKRDGSCCNYCGIRTTRHIHNADTQAEIDHVIPISRGGGHVMENVVVCCRKCNNEKSDKIVTLC